MTTHNAELCCCARCSLKRRETRTAKALKPVGELLPTPPCDCDWCASVTDCRAEIREIIG